MLARACRTALSLLLVGTLSVPWVAAADPAGHEVLLSCETGPENVTRVEVLFEADGDLKVLDSATAKEQVMPMKVLGTLAYHERPDASSSDTKTRGWRHYDVAKATITIQGRANHPTLGEDHRLLAVELGEQTAVTCPLGPLSGEELDLVNLPGNTLVIDQLLPDAPVSPDSTWQEADALWAQVLGLDAVSSNDVSLKLVELTDDAAKVHLEGLVHGAVDGVATELEIKGKIKFDRQARRITWFALLVKEKHEVGHTVPGLEALARVQIKITPAAAPAELNDAALAGWADYWQTPLTQLAYRPGHGALGFDYDRRWHVVHEDQYGAVLRFVDRGELIAQCNVTLMPKNETEAGQTLADFQSDIQAVLKDKFGQFVEAQELASNSGGRLLRVLASGTVAELPIQWNYHLVVDGEGRRAAAVVTVEQALVDRLEGTDRALVESLVLADRSVETAVQPQTARKQK